MSNNFVLVKFLWRKFSATYVLFVFFVFFKIKLVGGYTWLENEICFSSKRMSMSNIKLWKTLRKCVSNLIVFYITEDAVVQVFLNYIKLYGHNFTLLLKVSLSIKVTSTVNKINEIGLELKVHCRHCFNVQWTTLERCFCAAAVLKHCTKFIDLIVRFFDFKGAVSSCGNVMR